MLSPTRHLRRLLRWSAVRWFSFLLLLINVVDAAGDLWPMDRPDGMPSIQSLEVMCGKDHMDVHLTFSQPFEGIVSSKGQHGDPRCVYVPPSTGETFFSFRIAYARCGTKPDLHGQFYENTVVVQYDKDLLEVWDEAKRLRCEWFNDYEKTASKPPMVIADLDVIQLDFRGDNVDCWMEIQHGKGPWAPPVTGIVPLGSTLTLVVAINDYRGEFDMRVKSCVASDGGGHVIQLSDEFGCVLRPKMISRFLKARGADERASVITYAFFHAFKFPDALSVHIKCKVEICRHGCLDHCQLQPEKGDVNTDLYVNPLERKDDDASSKQRETNNLKPPHPDMLENERPIGDLLYDDLMQEPIVKMPLSSHFDQQQQQQQEKNSGEQAEAPSSEEQEDGGGVEEDDDEEDENEPRRPQYQQQQEHPTLDSLFASSTAADKEELDITALPHKDMFMMSHEQFPHGPRTFEEDLLMRSPVAAPRVFTDDSPTVPSAKSATTTTPTSSAKKRRRRSITVSDRRARSADVGVSGLYEVISEADLAFSPGDARAEGPVTVFQGRIREEVVYGICMPVPGFSILFVLVAVSAVVSALVAGTLLYRYQLQKEHLAAQARNGPIPLGIFAGGWRMLRARAAGFGAAARMNGVATTAAVAAATPSSAGGSSGASNANGKTDSVCHCE